MVNICKLCVKKESLNSDGSLNIENFKNMLSVMDKPYAEEAISSAIAEVKIAIETGKGRKDVIGNYFRIVGSLPQYSKLSFLQSLQLQDGGLVGSNITSTPSTSVNSKPEKVYVKQIDDFVVTDQMIDLFGEGYTKKMYRLMCKKYDKLKQNYMMKTSMHEEALAT